MTEGLPKIDKFSPDERLALEANFYEWHGKVKIFCSYIELLNEEEINELLLTWHKYHERSPQLNNLLLRLEKKYQAATAREEVSDREQFYQDHN